MYESSFALHRVGRESHKSDAKWVLRGVESRGKLLRIKHQSTGDSAMNDG
jgi:hypothetical protein